MSIRKSSWHQAGLRAVQLFDLPKTWLDPKSQKLARIETWLWHFFANGGWTDWPPWSAVACRDLRLPCSDRLPPPRSDHSQRWWSTFNWDLQHQCLSDSRAAECKIYEGRALSLHPLHRMHTLWPPAPPCTTTLWPPAPCSTSSKWCYGDNDDCGCSWRCQPDNSLATPCCCPQLTSTAVFVYRWIYKYCRIL